MFSFYRSWIPTHPFTGPPLIQTSSNSRQCGASPSFKCSNTSETPYSETDPTYSPHESKVAYSFTEDNIPIVNLSHLQMCPHSNNSLISKILGESLLTKLIASKCSVEWKPSGEFSIVDMVNGFSLVKFGNAMDRNRVLMGQPWFVGRQICCLQPWKRHFSPIKEKLNTVLLWIRLPRLPLEMWNEKVLIHIISSISNLVKIDHNSEEKGLFACICVAIDVSKPLKRMIKYVLDDVFYECLLEYENITCICFGCGSQSTSLMCANSFLKMLLLSWKSSRSSPKLMILLDIIMKIELTPKKLIGWRFV